MLSPDEKEQLMNETKKHSTALYEFLTYIDNDSVVAPDDLQDFLFSLSSSSPVCSYIRVRPPVGSLIDDIMAGVNIKQDPSKLKTLAEDLPIVYKVIASPRITSLPQPLVKLLLELWSKAKATFAGAEPHTDESNAIHEDELVFFPSLPKLRNRGLYAADLARDTNKSRSCRKQYGGHPTLLPGIFTVYCPHGEFYTFKIFINIVRLSVC